MNQWTMYSKNYSCTVAEAIHDRDYPMDRNTVIAEFKTATGRAPTEDEIKTMAPDSSRAVEDEASYQRRQWER